MQDHSDEIPSTLNPKKSQSRFTDSGAFTLKGKYDDKPVYIVSSYLNLIGYDLLLPKENIT